MKEAGVRKRGNGQRVGQWSAREAMVSEGGSGQRGRQRFNEGGSSQRGRQRSAREAVVSKGGSGLVREAAVNE